MTGWKRSNANDALRIAYIQVLGRIKGVNEPNDDELRIYSDQLVRSNPTPMRDIIAELGKSQEYHIHFVAPYLIPEKMDWISVVRHAYKIFLGRDIESEDALVSKGRILLTRGREELVKDLIYSEEYLLKWKLNGIPGIGAVPTGIVGQGEHPNDGGMIKAIPTEGEPSFSGIVPLYVTFLDFFKNIDDMPQNKLIEPFVAETLIKMIDEQLPLQTGGLNLYENDFHAAIGRPFINNKPFDGWNKKIIKNSLKLASEIGGISEDEIINKIIKKLQNEKIILEGYKRDNGEIDWVWLGKSMAEGAASWAGGQLFSLLWNEFFGEKDTHLEKLFDNLINEFSRLLNEALEQSKLNELNSDVKTLNDIYISYINAEGLDRLTSLTATDAIKVINRLEGLGRIGVPSWVIATNLYILILQERYFALESPGELQNISDFANRFIKRGEEMLEGWRLYNESRFGPVRLLGIDRNLRFGYAVDNKLVYGFHSMGLASNARNTHILYEWEEGPTEEKISQSMRGLRASLPYQKRNFEQLLSKIQNGDYPKLPVPLNKDELIPGERINPGEYITSKPSGKFRLIYRTNGNLVLYDDRFGNMNKRWSSETYGQLGNRVIMQGDGNLVIYTDRDAAIWHTHTQGNPGSRLILQDDGYIVIYTDEDIPIWKKPD